MEVTERKRSRKSRSFKRVNEDYQDDNCSDSSIESLGQAHDTLFVTGDVCEGLKKQVSGMRRFLNNKVNSVRIQQQMMPGQEKLKVEPGASNLTWLQRNVNQANVCPDQPHSSQSTIWKDIQTQRQKSCVSGGYSGEGSRSSKPVIASNTERLQGPQSTVHIPSSHLPTFRSSLLRNKIIKKRLIHRIRPAPAQPNPKVHNQSISLPHTEKSHSLSTEKLTTEINPRQSLPNRIQSYISELDSLQNNDLLEPEVRLAEGYDVFIPKSQLVSILLNYSRSGSLLFRKLVSAFFDDRTLASSLPNGKRKRGANDNRKGLDQNIVGAIKVFTERYCTLNQIDRLPGPKDWIQILQDQIKLARKRLKRGSVLEQFESSGKMGSSFVLNPGGSSNAASSSDMWNASEPVCTVQL
ncbi:BEN domain-containing protein 7 isoform X2 [Hemiscyllium ocellatum]|uniref:BEN domain-containing protein 7 isoform X2 n=1 Tax=Hemiscyllium ocellatum TaxID=170820 RepID=UPI002966C874|nr:BEN domain-containing protein 7 isoform X2 [Hemiscyllium ocellatum]